MNENQNEYVDINVHDNYPDSDQTVEIPTMKVIPLKKICMTIGELPSSYLETMTYYEMLVWFIEYLKNNIIPTVNNNGEAVEELQTVVMELQNYINAFKDSIDEDVEGLEDYVNNYFENLDVQEEINNKLDDMVESGYFEEIIRSYLKTQKIYNTHAEMIADISNLVNNLTVQTLGYNSLNDGGGAFYKIVNQIPSGKYYETVGEALYAELVPTNQYLDIRQLGIFPNTSTVLSVPIYNAFLTANQMGLITYIPKGTYIVKAKEVETTQGEEMYSHALPIPENSEVYFEKGSIIKLIDDADAWSRVVCPGSNVTIHGELTIDGSCDTVTSGNEHMAGLFIYDKENIYIENLHSYNCYGDNVQLSGNLEKTKPIIINNLKCEKAGRKNLVFESGNVHIHNALLDNTEGNVNSWEGGNSLDVEPFTYTTYKTLTIDKIETFGTGNDVTSGITFANVKNCILNFGTFIQHGGTFLSYGIIANVKNMIFYNANFNISYVAKWNIDNLIFYEQEKSCISCTAQGSPVTTPLLNINNIEVYGKATEYTASAFDFRSIDGHIGNLYIENYYYECLYLYGSTASNTSLYIDNITLKNCGAATGSADTNAIIISGCYTNCVHTIYISNISVYDTRADNKPSSVIKLLGNTDENKFIFVNNVYNATSYVTANTRYGNFVPVLQNGGTTVLRPTQPYAGLKYYDTTLGKYITYNGTAWINIDGSTLS